MPSPGQENNWSRLMEQADERLRVCAENKGTRCPCCGNLQIQYLGHDSSTVHYKCRISGCRKYFEVKR